MNYQYHRVLGRNKTKQKNTSLNFSENDYALSAYHLKKKISKGELLLPLKFQISETSGLILYPAFSKPLSPLETYLKKEKRQNSNLLSVLSTLIYYLQINFLFKGEKSEKNQTGTLYKGLLRQNK